MDVNFYLFLRNLKVKEQLQLFFKNKLYDDFSEDPALFRLLCEFLNAESLIELKYVIY